MEGVGCLVSVLEVLGSWVDWYICCIGLLSLLQVLAYDDVLFTLSLRFFPPSASPFPRLTMGRL